MAAENEDDPEGYLLAEARKILGERIPLVASFDLHGILTDRMLEHADAIVVYHTYPHVDFFETGQRAARLLLRLMAGEVKPVTARVFIPALVRGDELITAHRPLRPIHSRRRRPSSKAPAACRRACSSATPSPTCRTSVATASSSPTTIPSAPSARRCGWRTNSGSIGERMQAPLTSLEESVRLAMQTKGSVILMDAADATSSGASGDSNAILRELARPGLSRARRWSRSSIPPASQRHAPPASAATIRTTVGGALDAKRFQPLEIAARVRMLSDGRFRSESFGQEWYCRPNRGAQAGNITLVVTSRPVHLYDRSLFLAHGQDPRHFDLVVVKSPHCQPHMYADWCARLINVDAPGSTSANLPQPGPHALPPADLSARNRHGVWSKGQDLSRRTLLSWFVFSCFPAFVFS